MIIEIIKRSATVKVNLYFLKHYFVQYGTF